jgi:pimeloyl-ACP methyl ester carboxylesterase
LNTETQYAVEYQESGSGEAIVFVPGSFSTGSSWRAIATPLSERFRTITTSLSGYGKTQERRIAGGFHLEDELDVLETVLQKVDAPTHLVAHSFGAWAALLLAIRRPSNLLSLTLFEPTAFQILALCQETALNQHILDLVDRYTTDWNSANKMAVRHIIDFYGGDGTFAGYPEPVKEKLISQTATNILDWRSGFASPVGLEDIAAVHVSTLVVCGGRSHMVMRRCNQLLVENLPRSKLTMLDDANHFMIVTHAEDLRSIIERHVSG